MSNDDISAAASAKTTTPPRRRQRGDIRAPGLEGLSWAPEDCEASLAAVYGHVQSDALEAIRWYRRARVPKRRLAVATRFLAVFLLGAAGILPLVEVVVAQMGGGAPHVPAIWVSILVAVGAGALGFDRFYGASSGWIRYIQSEHRIRTTLENFELEWEGERALRGGRAPTPDEVQAMLARARAFATAVNAIVEDETSAWVEEFRRSITQINDALRARASEADARRAAAQPGAVNLTVTNGDQCDAGWDVTVDDGVVVHQAGQMATLRDLPPGLHVLEVIGRIGAAERRAQVSATVAAGAATDQKLTLS